MKLLTLTATATATLVTAALAIANPAQAFTFGTNGIQFDKNQTVDFTFGVTKGRFQSELQVFEVGPGNILTSVATLFAETQRTDAGKNNLVDEYIGTVAGGTVLNSTATFTFLAGKLYTLGVVNVKGNDNNATASVYSTTAFNSTGTQQAVFGSYGSAIEKEKFAAGGFTSVDPYALQSFGIAFEDILGGGDKDYNDFQVTAEVPEPLTMTGLALGAAGLAAARRRRKAS